MRDITGSMCPMGKAASATVASLMVVKDPFTVAPMDPKVPPKMQKDLSAPLINVITWFQTPLRPRILSAVAFYIALAAHETNDSEALEP